MSGTGVGTIILAPLVNALLSQYGWRVTFRIQAGIMLASVVRPAHSQQHMSRSVAGACGADLPTQARNTGLGGGQSHQHADQEACGAVVPDAAQGPCHDPDDDGHGDCHLWGLAQLLLFA